MIYRAQKMVQVAKREDSVLAVPRAGTIFSKVVSPLQPSHNTVDLPIQGAEVVGEDVLAG